VVTITSKLTDWGPVAGTGGNAWVAAAVATAARTLVSASPESEETETEEESSAPVGESVKATTIESAGAAASPGDIQVNLDSAGEPYPKTGSRSGLGSAKTRRNAANTPSAYRIHAVS
jgi:hypothetical protein